MKKEPFVFVGHMLEGIRNIQQYVKGVSKEEFMANKEKTDAVIRNLEIVGEAAKNIHPSLTKRYPHISWRRLTGTRDVIIHHYFGIDLESIWKTIQEDLPLLEKQLMELQQDLASS
ncbi:MAG: DUF86 domain-containing protein [Nanoarchaeota archaeon]